MIIFSKSLYTLLIIKRSRTEGLEELVMSWTYLNHMSPHHNNGNTSYKHAVRLENMTFQSESSRATKAELLRYIKDGKICMFIVKEHNRYLYTIQMC